MNFFFEVFLQNGIYFAMLSQPTQATKFLADDCGHKVNVVLT